MYGWVGTNNYSLVLSVSSEPSTKGDQRRGNWIWGGVRWGGQGRLLREEMPNAILQMRLRIGQVDI